MAFLSAIPLVHSATTTATTTGGRACICMKKRTTAKKKKGKSSPLPSSSAAASPTSSSAGFSPGAVPKTKTAKIVRTDAQSPDGVIREDATGEEGNTTPHNASVMAVQKLEDPTKQLASEMKMKMEIESEEISSLKTVDDIADEIMDLDGGAAARFDWKLSHDEIIQAFQDAKLAGNLEVVVRANRHFVSEAVLYRFTSAILQAQSSGGREEEVANMRELRKHLISLSWDIDVSFKRAILAAEERLMTTLQSADVGKMAGRQAGANRSEVDAYWCVVYAAISAWEERGRTNEELSQVDIQASLTKVAAVYSTNERILELISPCFTCVSEVLALTDPQEQSKKLDALNDNDVVKLASYIEQIRLLPVNAYDGLRRRLGTILDFILAKKYNIQPSTIKPFRFEPMEIERGSKIVSIQQTAAKQNVGFKMPKFPWAK